MRAARSASVLGSGYHYRGIFSASAPQAAASGIPGAVVGGADTRAPTAPGATAPGIVGLLNSGILNPFSIAQTAAGAGRARGDLGRGATLYGGKYEVTQFDASVVGPLFELPGGDVQVAVGVDYRRETYSFNGSAGGADNAPDIFNVGVRQRQRADAREAHVKAAYGEAADADLRDARDHRGRPHRRLHRLRHDHQSQGHGQVPPDRLAAVPRVVQHRLPRADVQPDLQRRHPIAQPGQHAASIRRPAPPAARPTSRRAARRSRPIR